jgi:copper(I)-binding protein
VTATAGRAAVPPGRDLWRDLVRPAAVPLIGVIVLVGILSAWVASGGAGTLTQVRLQITQAAIPMRGFSPKTATGAATTFLTIRNLTGTPDELTAVSSPVASRVVLAVSTGLTGARTVVGDLVVPAHGTLTLTPFGDDVVLQNPGSYENRTTVPLTLTFRRAGSVTIDAAVTAPGTPLHHLGTAVPRLGAGVVYGFPAACPSGCCPGGVTGCFPLCIHIVAPRCRAGGVGGVATARTC